MLATITTYMETRLKGKKTLELKDIVTEHELLDLLGPFGRVVSLFCGSGRDFGSNKLVA